MRVLLLALALVLAGCLPVAVLRTPEPVSGRSLAFGLSAVGVEGGVGFLPYAAYAQGDGQTEYNFSVQMGFRAGIKQALAPGFSLDMGLTLPPLLGGGGVPLALDAGLLVGLGDVYLSPRVHWIGFQSQNTSVSGLLYQATLGYAGEGFLGEGSILFSGQGGGLILVVSAAARF
ncbi:hypothetical protein KQ693_02090 [Thermus sp. PS18]|uniref:Lipoprotein n=1 Tax=Thermus brevis TaxID=2862456 RepID=A0ABS6ZVH5_9DEIN|nr:MULTISPECIES: hypothetical protein [Thermus]MBW6394056.1 hypothetical protein [Thermus brevis]UZX15856.1 hypothetical protein KQ693_02090 [Thermus sp. PS18]